MAPVVWLVRHGQSIWNAEGRVQGQSDAPGLTAQGEVGARLVARRLAATRAGAVVSSDAAPGGGDGRADRAGTRRAASDRRPAAGALPGGARGGPDLGPRAVVHRFRRRPGRRRRRAPRGWGVAARALPACRRVSREPRRGPAGAGLRGGHPRGVPAGRVGVGSWDKDWARSAHHAPPTRWCGGPTSGRERSTGSPSSRGDGGSAGRGRLPLDEALQSAEVGRQVLRPVEVLGMNSPMPISIALGSFTTWNDSVTVVFPSSSVRRRVHSTESG